MDHARQLLSNALKHIMIDGRVTVTFYLSLHLLLVLQLVSVIAHPLSDLFAAFQWFDPSNYLLPQYPVFFGFGLTLAFLLLLALRLAITQSHEELVKPSILMNYIGNILLHLQITLKTVVFIPMARAALTIIQNPTNPAHLAISILALVLYTAVLFPMFLYNTSNTFVLTPQINRKLTYWNVVILILLFKVKIVFASALSPNLIPPLCGLYLLSYLCLTVKQPVFAYSHEQMHKGLFSAAAFICLTRVANTILSNPKGEILIEIFGTFCFAAFVDWISNLRIKQIIDRTTPTIYQMKLLLFMVQNITDYLPKLQYYTIKHHQTCNNPHCLCPTLLLSFTDKTTNLTQQTIWYEFLVSLITFHYSLEQIATLPDSQLKISIQKYQYIVVDLAEIYLFKLKKIYLAYNVLNEYKCLTEKKGLHSVVYNQKRAVINYFLQCAVYERYKHQGEVNLYADKYMNFQIEFDRYQKYLLHSANKTVDLWQEMLKVEPDEEKLLSIVRILQKCNNKIRTLYHSITNTFEKSSEILQNITNEYYQLILNIPQKSPLHLIPTNKYDLNQKHKQRVEPLSENMNSFSYNSETPLCFVSVDIEDFGMIKGSNSIFNEVMSVEYGRVVSINEFIIPEMQASHRQRMLEFIRGDHFSKEHKNGFTLNSQGHLVLTKLLIQIVPSIADGLKYIAFFKKLLLEKRVVCIKNKNEIKYMSKSFEQDIQNKFNDHSASLLNYLTEQLQEELMLNQHAQLVVKQQTFQLHLLHSFLSDKGISYLFVEVIHPNIMMNSTSSKYRRVSSTHSGNFVGQDSVLSKFSNQHEPTIVDKVLNSEIHHQAAALEKERKLEESIRSAFQIIINRQNKKIISKINLVLIIAGLTRIAFLIAIIVLKNTNQTAYLSAANDNNNYNTFLQLIIRYTTDYKQLNLYAYQNNTAAAKQLYSQIQNYAPANAAMDNFLIDYDIPTLSQNWPTFAINSNATYNISSQNNFLAVSDNIMSPITNLNNAIPTNFNFPPSLELLSKPLTTIQIYFYQLLTNSIYVHIPSFRTLKRTIMDPILDASLDNYLPLVLLNLLTLVATIAWIAWVSTTHKKLTQLKTFSLSFLESLGEDILQDKQKQCQHFVNKYTEITEEVKPNKTMPGFAPVDFSDNSKNSRIFEDNTERQMESNFNALTGAEMIQNDALKEAASQKDKGTQSRAKANTPPVIFKRQSFALIVCKYVVPCLLLMVYCLVFTGLQIIQNQTMHYLMTKQRNVQYIQQDINMIKLYALQYGIYDPKLEQYLSIPTTFYTLVIEMFAIEQSLFSANKNQSTLPLTSAFISNIFYNDLCQLEQQGAYYSNLSFNSRGNYTYCLSISNEVLTKGLIASLLYYLQSANTLFLANTNSSHYNASQKLAYLSSPFFTNTVKLADYFSLIIDTMLHYYNIDFQNYVAQMTNADTNSSIVMILWLILIMLTFKFYYLKVLNTEIEDIHSSFLLVSYQTVHEHPHLKNMFTQQLENFELMK